MRPISILGLSQLTHTFVILPADYERIQIALSITRNDIRTTMVAYLAANSRSLGLLIVIHRKHIEAELLECGLSPDDCRSEAAVSFAEWFFTISVPETLEERVSSPANSAWAVRLRAASQSRKVWPPGKWAFWSLAEEFGKPCFNLSKFGLECCSDFRSTGDQMRGTGTAHDSEKKS
jgi:hypothetical protein